MRHERIIVRPGSPWGVLRLLGWREVAALAAVAALAVTLAVLAGLIFLLVFPFALAAGLVARWRAGRREGAREARSVHVEWCSRAAAIEPEWVEILPPRRPR